MKNIINENDVVTLVETGTTDKNLDLTRTDVNLIQYNPAMTTKKEKYVHNGKGTSIIMKKGIFGSKAK